MALVQPNTFDGISHRLILERWIQKYGFTSMAEVGVKKGRTLLYLLQARPELQITGVDIWEGDNAQYQSYIQSIVDQKYPGRATLVRSRSVDAAEKIPDASLDLVFIDADHSELAVWQDIIAWRRKVRPGGILCGHDVNQAGVRKAVDSLCPGWSKHDQEVWAVRVFDPPIITGIPYADDRNLGRAYNQFMEGVPDNGWGVLVDHDAGFTNPEWHRQLTAAVIARPDGAFTAMTNRVRCPYQVVKGIDPKNHDMAYHRHIGQLLAQNTGLRDVTNAKGRTPSGLIFVLSKQAWKEAGGFPKGLHYVDRIMWLALQAIGRKWILVEGLYLYHWHRAGHEPFQAGPWAVEHKIPGRGTFRLMNTEPLPTYGSRLTVKSDGEVYRFEAQTETEQLRVQTLFTKEPGTVKWIRKTVKPGDVFYDIGANIGQYSLMAAHRGASVVAFEPHLLTAGALMKNIQLNKAKGITVLTLALSDRESYRPFNYKHLLSGTSGSQFGTTKLETGGEFAPEAIEVKYATKIDTLIADQVIPSPTVVKIDVDGNELDVLLGMRRLLDSGSVRSLQVEMHPGVVADGVVHMLHQHGYEEMDQHISSLGEESVKAGVPRHKVFYNSIFLRSPEMP